MRICIVGASGKLGRYMVQHALDRGYEVVGVCRERSVGKLDALKGRITVIPGATNDRDVIKTAVAGCDAVDPGSAGRACELVSSCHGLASM
jgi:nucleoside-diphosphate-sugar epimerase